MRHAQRLLAASVASIVGKGQERAVASLFSPGGTHALKGEFAGACDFEVLAYLVVLAGPATPPAPCWRRRGYPQMRWCSSVCPRSC
jgi:hypothetical protein